VSNRRVGRDVYWRRRLLVLAGLIAIVWVILQIVGLVRGDGEPAASSPTPTATPATSASPTPEPTPTAPADQVSVEIETDTRPCDPTDVRILPSVAGGQYAGEPVDVDLMITTLGGSACTFEPDADQLLVVIDAGGAPIYDSSVCRAAFLPEAVAVPAGWGTVVPVEWTGRGSGAGCGTSEGFAPPGSYTLTIGTYGGEPGSTTFRLQRRPPETPRTSTTPPTSATPKASPTPKRPKSTSTAR